MNKEQQELVGDAYKNYCKQNDEILGRSNLWTLTKEEFINKIKTDDEFARKWGLRIEERELSEDEGNEIRDMQYFKNNLHQALKGSDTKIDWENIPTKLITITYNNKTIESYE